MSSSILPSTAEKPRYVAQMFGRIARRYDLLNTLMTAGQDERWRGVVADSLAVLGPRSSVLDVGTGTGRLAAAIQRARPDMHVLGVDFTLGMLRQAPATLQRASADALELPFGAEQFDAVVSAFVVRNLADLRAALAEQFRVLRPGGALVILETTPGPSGLLGALYRVYFRRLVPLLGKLIAGDASAYTYLPESTLAFVEPDRLATMLSEVGLVEVRIRRLALGCVAVTTARKPRPA